MFSNEKNERTMTRLERERTLDERLDAIGRELVRANQSTTDEIEETVSTPFLYARLSARIASVKENISTDAQNWWLMLVEAWRPLTGMALIAVTAVLLFWFTIVSSKLISPSMTVNGGEYLSQSDPKFDRIVFNDGDSLSDDDVLTTIFNQDETGVQK